MHKTLVAAVAVLVGSGGLAYGLTSKTAAQIQSQQQQLTASASGHQDGTLQQFTDTTLTLKPTQQSAGVAQLQVDSNAQVFSAVPNGLISSTLGNASLAEGANVRVYYQN